MWLTTDEIKNDARTDNVVRTTEGPAWATINLISSFGIIKLGASKAYIFFSMYILNILTKTNTSSIPVLEHIITSVTNVEY